MTGAEPVTAGLDVAERGDPHGRSGVAAGRAGRWRARLAAARAGLARALDVALPPLCLACRAPIAGHGGLCPPCWSKVDFIRPPLCDRLGVPLGYAVGGAVVSAAALASPPDFERARAVAAYAGVMRGLVHDLKYRDRHEGLDLFGRWLGGAGAELLRDADILMPVPLYRGRLWMRRFNQSLLLAQRVGRAAGVPVEPFALMRARRTASQVGLTPDQRRRNVAGAFKVAPAARALLAGVRVVLVDDVITTGATANACARALRRAGAARVDVLALARVVDPLAPRL